MRAAEIRERAGSVSQPPPVVTIIIVNYNSGEWLNRTLRRVAAQTFRRFQVIVVDNASSDGSARVCARYPDVNLVSLPDNLGFAAANNLAVGYAASEWIVFLNPDAVPHRRWLEQLLSHAEQQPQYRIFGCQQISANHPALLDGVGDDVAAFGVSWRRGHLSARTRNIRGRATFSVCGAVMLMRKRDFIALGGFDERFFCYVEDVDLCYRANLRGMRCWQVNEARVFHASSTSPLRKSNPVAIYYGYRNLLWMYVKNSPFALLPVAVLGYCFLTLAKAMAADTSEARSAYLRALRDGWAGVGDALAARRDIQSGRTCATLEIASRLIWNPLKLPSNRLPWRAAARAVR